ncbi:MAG: PAS domain S-box protein, partial [Gammaproteobacteria bacterium]|nr:PAS domain S-box protein [Gammaproteobacteria bacterium]
MKWLVNSLRDLFRPAMAVSPLSNRGNKSRNPSPDVDYRKIFENAVEGIYQTTPEGTFTAANAALAQILGYDSPQELMSSVDNIGSQLYVDPNKRIELLKILDAQGWISGYEFELRRKDGAVVWVSENARVVRDENGKVSLYEGSLLDITSRHKAEVALLRSEER